MGRVSLDSWRLLHRAFLIATLMLGAAFINSRSRMDEEQERRKAWMALLEDNESTDRDAFYIAVRFQRILDDACTAEPYPNEEFAMEESEFYFDFAKTNLMFAGRFQPSDLLRSTNTQFRVP